MLRQTSAFSELIQAGVENARKAATAPSFAEAARTRVEFVREVMAKANDVNRGNWASLRAGFTKSRDRLRGAAQRKATRRKSSLRRKPSGDRNRA